MAVVSLVTSIQFLWLAITHFQPSGGIATNLSIISIFTSDVVLSSNYIYLRHSATIPNNINEFCWPEIGHSKDGKWDWNIWNRETCAFTKGTFQLFFFSSIETKSLDLWHLRTCFFGIFAKLEFQLYRFQLNIFCFFGVKWGTFFQAHETMIFPE